MGYSRRQFFSKFVKPFVSSAEAADEPKPSLAPAREWLRPPGALGEDEFLRACTRCTDCIEACPYQSIRRLGPEIGDQAGTPAIIWAESPCFLCEEMPCISACEPEALVAVPRDEVNLGTARLQNDACYLSQGQRCDYCVSRCPLKGTAIAWGPDRLPAINAEQCAGCGVCAYLCPANALSILPADPAPGE